jgi:hypothetical protein
MKARVFETRPTSSIALLAAVLAGVAATAEPPAPTINEALTGRPVFPANNWWNLDVSTAPVDASSAAFIDFVSGRSPTTPAATRRLHPDFGPHPYGIPYLVVPGSQPRVPVTFSHHRRPRPLAAV